MSFYSRSHLADQTLLDSTAAHLAQNNGSTAIVLADLAEVDKRELYVPAGYSSMFRFCVDVWHLSEDVAFKRIRAARAARRFPTIFEAVADGRLNLSGVVLLAPHLTRGNAAELLAAARHKTNAEIELLLARRFPKPDVPTEVRPVPATTYTVELAVRPVGATDESPESQLAVRPVGATAETAFSASEPPLAPRARVAPRSAGRFGVQFTVDDEEHTLLRYAQALLGHAVPSGDVGKIYSRALREMVEKLERQKFAKCVRTHPRRGVPKGRYVPAEVRRTVWQRDGGRCRFVSDKGKRCDSTTRLEFDHVDPVARGGQASVDRMRLRCRAHNQYEAERVFSADFMRRKREESRCRAEQARAQAGALAQAEEHTHQRPEVADGSASDSDVMPWLRQLGFSAAEARRGAERCAHMPDAPLERRVRVAVGSLAPPCVRRAAPSANGSS